MRINQNLRIKRENADSKRKNNQTNTKRKKEKKKKEGKEKDAPFLLLRTAVKIYMFSPLLEADREVEN